MTRFTFDPRFEFTLDERRRYCRTFSVGIVDQELRPLGSANHRPHQGAVGARPRHPCGGASLLRPAERAG